MLAFAMLVAVADISPNATVSVGLVVTMLLAMAAFVRSNNRTNTAVDIVREKYAKIEDLPGRVSKLEERNRTEDATETIKGKLKNSEAALQSALARTAELEARLGPEQSTTKGMIR